MYFPLYTYSKELRYNAYLSFIVRSRGLNKSGSITKSEFIQKSGLDKRTARDVWDKGAFICEYFRGKDGDTLYIAKRVSNIVCDVPKDIFMKVKTLCDFKLFCTALQCGKNNDYGNRSRTLRTIGKETGTAYKQTVCKRVKRAKKLGLTSKQRFVRVGNLIAQISNSYNFHGVTFLYNKFTPQSIGNEIKQQARELKKKATQLEIVGKVSSMVNSSFYEDYSLLWNSAF